MLFGASSLFYSSEGSIYMTTKELADNAIFLSALQMLERMLERKLLSPAEAERARAELKRRLRPTLIYA